MLAAVTDDVHNEPDPEPLAIVDGASATRQATIPPPSRSTLPRNGLIHPIQKPPLVQRTKSLKAAKPPAHQPAEHNPWNSRSQVALVEAAARHSVTNGTMWAVHPSQRTQGGEANGPIG